MPASITAPVSASIDPPRPRTEAQREAARRNGRKSRGPTTPEGRTISRRNALRHGHRAEHPDLLPPDLRAAAAAERRAHEAALRPRDEFERTLVRQAADASARLARLQAADLGRAEERARRAVERWDAERAEEVDRLTRGLWMAPDLYLPKLLATAEGCAQLADAWQALADAVEAAGRLSDGRRATALALLGLARAPGDDGSEAAELLRLDREGRAEALLDLIDAKLVELDARAAALWERVDSPDRAAAPLLAAFDASPEGRLLARYLAESERMQRRALAALERHRRAAPKEPEGEDGPHAEARRAQGEEGTAPASPPASFATSRETLPAPAPNEPGPARDPRDRKRRPDPRELLRRARR